MQSSLAAKLAAKDHS